jgi:hypothetical protein
MTQEASENVIDMSDDDPTLVTILLMHLYGFSRSECSQLVYGKKSFYVGLLAPLYQIATKYMIFSMQDWIKTLLENSFKNWMQDVDAGSTKLRHPIWIWDLVRRTEESRCDALRDSLLARFRTNAAWLTEHMPSDELEKGLISCPEFATRLLMTGGLDGKGAVFKSK